MITDKERYDASNALMEWFKSQELDPADGSQVMLHLMAIQFVAKTKDIKELETSIRLTSMVLSIEIAALLKQY